MSAIAIKDYSFELVTEFAKPDKKKRITLGGKLSEKAFNLYANKFGQILLDPVRTVPASEAWLYENPTAIAVLKRGLQESAEGKVHAYGSVMKKKAKAADLITSSGKFVGSFDRGETYER